MYAVCVNHVLIHLIPFSHHFYCNKFQWSLYPYISLELFITYIINSYKPEECDQVIPYSSPFQGKQIWGF